MLYVIHYEKMRNDLYSYLVEDLCFLLTSQSIDWNIHFDINILYGFLEQWLRHIDVLYQAEVIPTSLTMLILYMNRGRKSLWYEEKKENNVPCSNPVKVYMFSMKTIKHTSCFRSTFTLIWFYNRKSVPADKLWNVFLII